MPNNAFFNGGFSRRLAATTVFAGLSILLFTFTGCGQSDNGLLSNRSAVQAFNTKLSVDLMDINSLFGAERINPFESQLPTDKNRIASLINNAPNNTTGPDVATPSGDPATLTPPVIAPPPTDPFADISLGGIIYHHPNSMAILKSGTGAGGVVKKGDSFNVNGIQIVVDRIDKTSVKLRAPGQPKEVNTKTFTVPSMIGYKGSEAKSSGAKEIDASGSNPALDNKTNAALSTDANRLNKAQDIPQEIMDLIQQKLNEGKGKG